MCVDFTELKQISDSIFYLNHFTELKCGYKIPDIRHFYDRRLHIKMVEFILCTKFLFCKNQIFRKIYKKCRIYSVFSHFLNALTE